MSPGLPPVRSEPSDRAESVPGFRLALAGGGTGGHIVPGLNLLATATASAASGSIGSSVPLADVLWFTSGRSVEDRVLASLDADSSAFERVVLALESPAGGAPSRAGLAWRTAPAVLRARRALLEHRSQVLLGLGGFTSLPAVLAARSLGIPVALLEVNATDGTATRWLARFSSRVFHAWPIEAETEDPIRERRRFLGPPLAPAFDGRPIAVEEQAAARVRLGFAPDRPLLLVLGGSQGAGALNAFVRAHAPALVGRGIQVLHQTGPGKLEEGCPAFTGYRALEYVAPVRDALAAATLVLCRGGASTLAEVAACGRPAFVVPYPHHADRHQERNARKLGTGVRIVDESRLTVPLREEIERLCASESEPERERMSATLRSSIPADATARLYAELVSLSAPARSIGAQQRS